MPGEVSYGASKNVLESYTRAAGKELARFGVTANLIVPGATQTRWITPELEKIILPDVPAGRIGQPEDIADVITMLASKWRKSKFQTSPIPGRRTSSWWKKRSIASTSRRRAFLMLRNHSTFFLRNREGEIRGGLIGIVQAGWLHTGTLWIHVRYRRRGYGAELMRSDRSRGPWFARDIRALMMKLAVDAVPGPSRRTG